MDELPSAVVATEKNVHQGRLHGHISGGGTMDLGNGYALKFIPLSKDFASLQLLFSGIGKPIKNQSWLRPKVVKKTTKKTIVRDTDDTPIEEIKQRRLI